MDLTVGLSGKSMEVNLARWLEEADSRLVSLEGGKELVFTIRVGKEGIGFGDMVIGGWEN